MTEITVGNVLTPVAGARGQQRLTEPILVLRPARRDWVKGGERVVAIGLGKVPRNPRYWRVSELKKLIAEGCVQVGAHVLPDRTQANRELLSEAEKTGWDRNLSIARPLIHSESAALLDDPDGFNRLITEASKKGNVPVRALRKVVWMWLTRGRSDAALCPDYHRCGAPGAKRGFATHVPGKKQGDGPDFDCLAANPYSLEERQWLRQLAERLKKRRRLTREQRFLVLRSIAIKKGLSAPSFDQMLYLLRDHMRRKRLHDRVGLEGRRYRGEHFATEAGESDSTQLQVFTRAESTPGQLLKNPTCYRLLDVETGFAPALLVTYEAPSNDVLSELIIRAHTGMALVCEDLGMPVTHEQYPRAPVFHRLWVDHQELTSAKLDQALLVHLGTDVHLAIVGQGSDKGKIEGSIGQVKREVRKIPGAFDKHALGQALKTAMRGAKHSLRDVERELIKLQMDQHLAELEPHQVSRDFLSSGRALNRKEYFLWSLQAHREQIRPYVEASSNALKFLLPVIENVSVHAGEGIYLDPCYYYSHELVASGLLRKHAKGATPKVTVARHRGTTNFIYWVRGPTDYVKCNLRANLQKAYGDMTVAEAAEAVAHLPPRPKRERLRKVQSQAQAQQPRSRSDSRDSQSAHRQAAKTRAKSGWRKARSAEAALNAERDASRRFPDEVKRRAPTSVGRARVAPDEFADAHAERVAQMLRAQRPAGGKG